MSLLAVAVIGVAMISNSDFAAAQLETLIEREG